MSVNLLMVNRDTGGILSEITAADPDLLFLDEPTVGLDVESRRTFWSVIRGLVEQGRTIVLTTHYLEEADADTPAVTFAPVGYTLILALTIPVFVLGIFATPLLNAVSKLSLAVLGGN